jgi:hypothetical protein
MRVSQGAPSTGNTAYLGLPVYVLLYFLLVPGALFCYQSEAPATLATLLNQGLRYFWRFVRITLLAGVVALIVLGPLFALNAVWVRRLDERNVGEAAFVREAIGIMLIVIVGAIIRLYFDLVEVYTVRLGLPVPDYRVRRALLPALRTMARGFTSNMIVFLFLTILGSAMVAAAGRFTLLSLAQPRVWPGFLTMQAGLLAMVFTRFWQRGAQTALVGYDFAVMSVPEPTKPVDPHDSDPSESDPLPPPEPIAPALDGPDPGVFHHDPQGLAQE